MKSRQDTALNRRNGGTHPSVRAMRLHLRENAGRYFPDIGSQQVRVVLVCAQRRPFSSLYRFIIRAPGWRRTVVVKLLTSGNRRSNGSQASRNGDRPRLFRVPEAEFAFEFEHAALSAIHAYYQDLNDPRFGTIRVLDILPGDHGIVMEYVNNPPLSKLLLKGSRFAHPLPAIDLRTPFQNAGAWLRAYHRFAGPEQSRRRHCHRSEFITSIHQFTQFLGHAHGDKRFFQRVASKVEAAAHQTLPERLPFGISHGDYAPHNILVGFQSRVTGFDTLALWQAPIYEDISHFLTILKANKLQIYSQGLAFSSAVIGRCEADFLRGYFAQDAVPDGAIRTYEAQMLLNKWASVTHSRQTSRGTRRIYKHCRLAVISRFYRRCIDQLDLLNL